ncbi:COG1470 family protein [Pseudomonas tohonis]|uniref:COG1470 family protein n=1 Tax=Pseudomonas tohonis TaxID=2725477 RepID=UPI001F4923DF|nr:hypothetical protein [Pseudomonas tohonis]
MDMLVMPSESKRRSRAWLGLALGALLAGWTATAQAFFGFGLIPGIYIPQTYYKFGAVYTRAIVLSPNGKPIWVEYGSDGKEAREIGEATGPLEQAQVMSGDIYRAYLQRLKDARERYPQSEVMTAATYRGTSFKTVDGKAIDKPSLSPSSLTVLVRGEKERFSTKGDELLLLQMPIDSNVTPSSSSKALLLSKEGQILHQGSNSIGFRAGFFGKDGKVDDKNTRDRDAKIYGPLPGVGVTLGSHVTGGYALTDDDGKYRMNYFLPPCPGFFFEYTTPAYLELYYKRFNPRGSSNMPYYLTRPDYDTCNGMGLWSLDAAMVVLTAATPMKQAMDFPIDLMVLDGSAQFGGGVKLGDKTAYSDKTGKRDNYLQEKYDFDGDGKPDWVVPGKKVTKEVEGKQKEVFVKTSLKEAELQGIYISSRFDAVPENTEKTGPDFTRLIDVAPDMENRGLLESISKDDLKDTDIYVFRESNGQLVAERRGLHEDELYKNYSGVDEKSGSFRYTIQLRGSKENNYAIVGRTGEAAFSKWQSAGGFKEEFQKRAANHLKAGETVRIIAINRPTGYMGSTKVQLQSAIASGNLLNFASQRIELSPPNLKVWAERKTKIEKGITKGKEQKNLIGNEGAGLGSDISIAIYTDWRDIDGGALPEELADYGFTGRMAKIVAANQLAPVGANNLSQFKIKPGQQVQIIQLPEKVLAKQHLYLQVTGQPENRNPDFSSKGQASGILKYRPTHYVPVRVPLHDEEGSELSRQAWRKAKKEQPEADLKQPEPIYNWSYRPELQFSLYDLNVESIRRQTYQNVEVDVLSKENPVITSSDNYVKILYDLLQSNLEQLGTWETERGRELVLAFGEQEIKAKIGEDKTITFDNIAHLGKLDPDDFLNLRLFANHDSGNVLWKWAFEYFKIDTQMADIDASAAEKIFVSADDPQIDLQAILVGYANREEEKKTPLTANWSVEGDGFLSTYREGGNLTGTFFNTLRMSPGAGAKAVVKARLGDDEETTARLTTVEVVPGAPKTVFVDLEGTVSQLGIGALNVKVTAYDKNFNRVGDETGVDFSVDGDSTLTSNSSYTLGGSATTQIKGGIEPGTYNLKVRVGAITVEKTFEVHPLKLEFANVPPKATLNSTVNFSIKATDIQNVPATGVAISVFTNAGFFNKASLITGGDGIAQAQFFTGFDATTAEIYARTGFTPSQKQMIVIAPPPPQPGVGGGVNVKRNLILGEAVATDKVEIDRGDGVVLRMPYRKSGQIDLTGTKNETVSVELGSITDPNRQPLIALMMLDIDTEAVTQPDGDIIFKQYAIDSLGLRRPDAENIELSSDGPYAGEGGSYSFKEDSVIRAPGDPKLNPGAIGVRFDVRLEKHGVLLRHGPLEISSSSSGLQAQLTIDGRTEVVTGPALEIGAWSSVGVQFKDGQLSLAVNNQLAGTRLISGAPVYGMSRLTIGGFVGLMRAFKWYDSSSRPLLTFEDGQTKADVRMPEQGSSVLTYVSTDEFNKAQSGSNQSINRVVVQFGAQLQYVNVMGVEAYKELSLNYLNTAYQGSEVPPIDYDAMAMNLNGTSSGNFFIPAAYAFSLTDVVDSAVDGLIFLGNMAFPFEDIKIVYDQINYYIAKDWANFSVETLAFASLNVITGLPIGPTRLLKPVVKVLQLFYKYLGKRPKAIKAMISVMEDLIIKAKSGKFDRVTALVPYFLTVAELMRMDTDSITYMVNSIDGLDDILAWVDYLSLPAEGWEGTGAPPEVELFGWMPLPDSTQPYAQLMPYEQVSPVNISFFQMAYAAAPKIKPKRLPGEALSPVMKQIKEALGDDPKPLVEMMKTVSKVMREGGAPALRKFVFDKQFFMGALTLGQRGSQNALRNIVRGFKGMRVHPMLLLASIAYIEEEAAKGKLVGKKALVEKIRGKYVMSLASLSGYESLMEENPALDVMTPIGMHNGAQGATFQILVTAYYLATDQLVDIEVPRIVRLFTNKKNQDANKEVFRALRYVDIMTKDEGWVELKSLRRSYKDPRDLLYTKALDLWNITSDKSYSGNGELTDQELKPTTKYHKQFSLDRIAKNIGAITTKGDGGKRVDIGSVKWWFHEFDVPARKSTSGSREQSPEIDNGAGGIPDRLMTYPMPGGNKALKYSYGKKWQPSTSGGVVASFDAKNLVFDALKRAAALPKGVKDAAEFDIKDD